MIASMWMRKYLLRPVAIVRADACDIRMEKVLYLSLVTASVSFTVAEAKLFLLFREWCTRKLIFVGELMSCGYCLGHWVAFALFAIYRPRLFEFWCLVDYFLTALVIAWLAAF
jgi:hypothetical protein